jgi:hypothetical protein
MESQKYKLGGQSDIISPDGGTLANTYEKGTLLGLEPLDYGDPSLVGLWTFDEGGGSQALDYSGNNASGTWSGTPGYTSGQVGPYAGNFNGSNNYVSRSLFNLDTSQVWSVALWSNFPSQPYESGLWGITPTYTLFINASSTYVSLYWAAPCQSAGKTVAGNQWNFWVVTRNGNTFTLYDNGTPFTSMSCTNTTSQTTFAVGGEGTAHPYLGAIDDVRVYNRALSAAEVQAIYNGGR